MMEKITDGAIYSGHRDAWKQTVVPVNFEAVSPIVNKARGVKVKYM